MSTKRSIELVNRLACPACEVGVPDMNHPPGRKGFQFQAPVADVTCPVSSDQ